MQHDPSVKLLSIHNACRVYDLSRSTLYRRAARGCFVLVKDGSRSKVDKQSADNYFNNLPKVKLQSHK